MKRYTWVLAALLGLLLTLAGCSSAGEKDYIWQQFDSEVRVTADGGLQVSETLTLRYTGGPFTFAFRDLPYRRLDTISNITVSAADRRFSQVDDSDSSEPFTFSVSRQDEGQRIRWVYPEASGGTQTFVVSYDVAGAVRRYADHDEIWWSLVPANPDKLVERASGSLIFAQPVPVADLEASTPDVGGQIASTPGAVAVQAASIPTSAELTLRVRFPKGIVGGPQPGWQSAADAQASYDATTRPLVNLALSAVAAGLALGLGLLLWFWWRRNRDPQGRGFVGAMLPGQPDDLAPALAAKLLRTADSGALLATILDLARRSYLTLYEIEKTSVFSQASVEARRLQRDTSDLTGYEQLVLDALFESADSVELSKRQGALLKAAGALGKATQQALVERGYLDAPALRRRSRARSLSGGLVIVALGLGVLGLGLAERFSWWLPVVAGVLLLLALTWLILSVSLHGTTQLGADMQLRWRAFQHFIRQLKPAPDTEGRFNDLLAYATALGNQKQLITAYSATSEPLPFWYFPVHSDGHAHGQMNSVGDGGPMLLLQDFSQSFLASLSSTSASTADGGGGGGASGGGGAGAGLRLLNHPVTIGRRRWVSLSKRIMGLRQAHPTIRFQPYFTYCR